MKTEDALRRYMNSPERISELSEIAGVAADSVGEWLHGHLPRGETLLRVRAHLWLQGQQIDEFERLSEEVRALALLIARGAISLQEVVKQLSYHEPSWQQIYRVLLAGHEFSPQRSTIVAAIINEHRDQLNGILKDGKSTPNEPSEVSVLGGGVDSAQGVRQVTELIGCDHAAIMALARSYLAASLSLLEYIASDAFSPEERARFREQFPGYDSGDGIHRVSDVISTLLSEGARKNVRAAGRTGGVR